jgi:hypothetical protein
MQKRRWSVSRMMVAVAILAAMERFLAYPKAW